ncbi:uncharacterized protein PG986_008700 [Apiospora aurea]|uniref:Uncharacterized protein n=1 Tax=Apiospora aurea TaxID=335848 RepID=A0ABR1Q5L4_9PEZI
MSSISASGRGSKHTLLNPSHAAARTTSLVDFISEGATYTKSLRPKSRSIARTLPEDLEINARNRRLKMTGPTRAPTHPTHPAPDERYRDRGIQRGIERQDRATSINAQQHNRHKAQPLQPEGKLYDKLERFRTKRLKEKDEEKQHVANRQRRFALWLLTIPSQ